ncbi:hypothetical protein DHEL01_v209309 [Diaporthe helianthi]|uniref:Transcriptional coactivator p15 (PC4) C-terminal domain-containing protein n=1 Tax=Diaporthe helianthi TaxID=158607 RepID=A0A2P5HPX2_DIAHE|nr:hypothetical protein DHEL01_v209309 [Diaporthe helianthi]
MVKRRSSFVVSENSSGDERPAKTSKKAKQETKKGSSSKNGKTVDSEGNTFFELSDKRRVVVQEFQGKWFVNLREYYEDKSGEMKPGKKGIMLNIDQYQAFLGAVPAINKALGKHGVKVAGGDTADDGGEEEGEEKPIKSKKKESKSKKANIEATSDEEEDEDDDEEDD